MSSPHAGSSPDAHRRPPDAPEHTLAVLFGATLTREAPGYASCCQIRCSMCNLHVFFEIIIMFLEMQRKKKEKKKQEDHHPLGFCAFAFHSPGRLGWDGIGWDGMDGLDGC